MLEAVRTGTLYRSTMAVYQRMDAKVTSVILSQSFRTYGVFVNYGTGSNTPRGNSGDIGRPNRRKKKPWFSKKYFASAMNIQEFFADNLGREFCNIISNALSADAIRRAVTINP